MTFGIFMTTYDSLQKIKTSDIKKYFKKNNPKSVQIYAKSISIEFNGTILTLNWVKYVMLKTYSPRYI